VDVTVASPEKYGEVFTGDTGIEEA